MPEADFPCLLRPDTPFPDVSSALRDPNGLLAIGGDLSVPRLIRAYRRGIFPWFSKGEPILWWCPDPRSVIFVDDFRPSRSIQKLMRKNIYQITFDRNFQQVISLCASTPRSGQHGTWITPEIIQAYQQLFEQGFAHSVECWHHDRLVGGLYGVAMGRIFYGESMFSLENNTSKLAFSKLMQGLKQWGYVLVDCQVESSHMNSLGAVNIAREQFVAWLARYSDQKVSSNAWVHAN